MPSMAPIAKERNQGSLLRAGKHFCYSNMMETPESPAEVHVGQDDELRRLRRELAQVSLQLDLLQQRKTSLLAMAAHDLRTPLAIVQGYSQLLADDLLPEATPAVREYVINILAHAHSLGNMIENLMSLEQLERNQLHLAVDCVELCDVADQAIAQVEGLLLVKELKIESINTPVCVTADEGQIRRILYNVLSHAAKYARPASTLRIEVMGDGEYGRVSLTDPNRFLNEDTVARLFELVDVNTSGHTALRGMDIGLVLARQVIDRHGGRVAAASTPHSGTTLSLYLPIADV